MKPAKSIFEILEDHRGEKHIVILHEYPDPDAIAAGYAHRMISREFDIEADILYSGTISHPQNIALIQALDYKLIPCEAGFDFSRYDAAVFVDHQGTTVNEIVEKLKNAGVKLLITVDHHEEQDQFETEYMDIRKTGSTSTIYVQYLKQGQIELETSNKKHVLMATALTHGIMTDTNSFIRAKEADLHAAAYLSDFRDAELLNLIMNQCRTKQVMDIIQLALENRMNVENYIIAGVGYVEAEDRDAIPEAADFLLTEENIHTVIVYGIVRGNNTQETLIGSLRTDKYTLNPDEFLKHTFGKDPAGNYFGGGKQSAGGFAIPVSFLSSNYHKENRDLNWYIFDEQIKTRLLTKIGVDPKLIIEEGSA
ncbi:MAG: DHH family phosphoesterase [Anaerolineales bacterium]|nr:DHH family phosphoesterase [Anaerolineales bacterium]